MPRSKEDFKEITLKRKNTILETALRLFSLYGYDTISIDQITKESKCSHGLFYHYFNSKQDLLDQLLKTVIHYWNKEIEQIDLTQNPLFALKDLNVFVTNYLKDDAKTYILYLFLTFHLQKNIPVPKIKNKEKFKNNRPFAKLFEIINKGQELGVFVEGEPLDYIRIYFSALQGLAYSRIHLGAKKFKPVNIDALTNIFLKKEEYHV